MNKLIVTVGERKFEIAVDGSGGVSLDGIGAESVIRETEPGVYSLVLNGRSHRIVARRDATGYVVLACGLQQAVTVESARTLLIRKYANAAVTSHQVTEIRAPMPALVGRIHVKPGDEVTTGQPLLVLEAMKMENEIKAHHAGVVSKLLVSRGETVEKGTLLLVFD